MTARHPALADRYAIHLPIDAGDSTPRFVGTDVTTGQSVMVTVTTGMWAQLHKRAVGVPQRHLATVLEAIPSFEASCFPADAELPATGTIYVAELVRGRCLVDVLRDGPLAPERAVAWTIRILEGLALLHRSDVPHGAISAAAVVAEPRLRPIAPVLSQLMVPAFREYASPERLNGEGPSIEDDLWAVGVLLFEMLASVRPFESTQRLRTLTELGASDVSFLDDFPHGAELGVILRKALAGRQRRFTSATEMMTFLDNWERRQASPSTTRSRAPAGAPVAPARVDARAWDVLVEQSSFGIRRLEAALDAAEHMRQSVLNQGVSMVAEPRKPAGKDEPVRSPVATNGVVRGTKSGGPKSGGPKSRRSLGPELAAFAARSRPKAKAAFGLLGLLGALLVGGMLWAFYQDKAPVAVRPNAAKPKGEPRPNSATRADLRPKLSAKEEADQCIRSYFRDGAVRADADLGFVCSDEDFLSANRRLHEESLVLFAVGETEVGLDAGVAAAAAASVSAEPVSPAAGKPAIASPTGSANPALVIRPGASSQSWQLGWYELVATAIIRQSCCREAAPIKLPESTGWCQQMQAVVRRIASDSAKVGDISPGVRTFDEAITCLLAQGKHTVYPYKVAPTPPQKTALQQFLKHAAEVDAQRSSRR